jgi:hypothetical protein
VLAVEHVGLGRERLSAVLASAAFANRQHLTLHVSRKRATVKDDPISGDVFATLKLLRADGSTLQEYPSDIWPARTDAAWGACWTIRCPRGAAAASLSLHRSLLFTDPVVGRASLCFDEMEQGEIRTAWHGFRPERDRWATRAVGTAEASIHGEALLSVRRCDTARSCTHFHPSGRARFICPHIHGEAPLSVRRYENNTMDAKL